jgi:NDP-sugar pyrophosphorylase family protein
MAGAGSRFFKNGITTPKPLIEVLNKTLIEYSVNSFNVPGRFIFITRTFDDAEHNKQLTHLLKKLRPESIEIKLDKVTNGAAETVLAAEKYIDNNDPLVVYNCDQIINWNGEDFLKFVKKSKPRAALVLYKSKDPKNSFADLYGDTVLRVVEKQAISDHALIGFHYWQHGKDFVNSAKDLLENFKAQGKKECYVSETFNHLKDKNILAYHLNDNAYISLGTPQDVSRYIGQVKEFDTEKPKTLFIDIDGTVLKHMHTISDAQNAEPEILPGVVEKINEWDSQGHKIIFVTARKESTRHITESQLRQFGLAWDMLIMGASAGERLLINDKLYDSYKDRAIGVNVITNQGFQSIDWSKYKL